jgi:hypothetical protein
VNTQKQKTQIKIDMLLTDKAKEDFGDKCFYQFKDFKKLPEVCQNALIIEWLDRLGIFIQIDFESREPVFSYYIFSGKNICSGEENAKSRTEATQKAILKANEIYNDLNK